MRVSSLWKAIPPILLSASFYTVSHVANAVDEDFCKKSYEACIESHSVPEQCKIDYGVCEQATTIEREKPGLYGYFAGLYSSTTHTDFGQQTPDHGEQYMDFLRAYGSSSNCHGCVDNPNLQLCETNLFGCIRSGFLCYIAAVGGLIKNSFCNCVNICNRR